MYKIYDKPEAIKRIQEYLNVVGNKDIFVIPSGIYDENTRLSVIDFQNRKQINATGIVDYITFDILHSEYANTKNKNTVIKVTDGFIKFPLRAGDFREEMMHLNRTMKDVLLYYGHTSSLGDSNFYSLGTSQAVMLLREIYSLDLIDEIDEEFYYRLIKDHNSISKSNKRKNL